MLNATTLTAIVFGWLLTPKDIYILIPETCDFMMLAWKRRISVANQRTSNRGSWFNKWTQCAHRVCEGDREAGQMSVILCEDWIWGHWFGHGEREWRTKFFVQFLQTGKVKDMYSFLELLDQHTAVLKVTLAQLRLMYDFQPTELQDSIFVVVVILSLLCGAF